MPSYRGEAYITPGLAARLLTHVGWQEPGQPGTLPELTERGEQILAHVARGLTNKEIARALSLSEKTVKDHMTNIMQKLQVRNRVEAAMVFRKQSSQAPSSPASWRPSSRLKRCLSPTFGR